MGMTACLIRIPSAKLEDYLTDSEHLENDIHQLFEQTYEEGEVPHVLDLDKSWDGIIFLLCGKGLFDTNLADQSSLSRTILSGNLIDEEQDLGYGPAHYLTAEETASFAQRLNAITPEDLCRNFIPENMEGVYPDFWQDEGVTALEYLLYHFQQMQKFYACAAREKQAVIGFIF